MYSEDDLLPISALQHLLFCERQCALIHIERIWEENVLTVEGHILHERVDAGGAESRSGVRAAYGVALRSLELGLSGKADVVEFHQVQETGSDAVPTSTPVSISTPVSASVPVPPKPENLAAGIASPRSVAPEYPAAPLPGAEGLWVPFPVEYKRGRPKAGNYDEVQLCAQALCLEEMLGAAVPAGALFYGSTRRRRSVAFAPELRRSTIDAAARLHELIAAGVTPAAEYAKKCERCSLKTMCLPKTADGRHSARKYLEKSGTD